MSQLDVQFGGPIGAIQLKGETVNPLIFGALRLEGAVDDATGSAAQIAATKTAMALLTQPGFDVAAAAKDTTAFCVLLGEAMTKAFGGKVKVTVAQLVIRL